MINTWLAVLRPPADIMSRLVYDPKLHDPFKFELADDVEPKVCASPGCGNMRRIFSNGKQAGYCRECSILHSREFRKRRKEGRIADHLLASSLNQCATPGCGNPRHQYEGPKKIKISYCYQCMCERRRVSKRKAKERRLNNGGMRSR